MQGSKERLFWVSVLLLFLEVALIRFVSTEIRIFAYLDNMVLLATFLGMGLGCWRAKATLRLEATLGSLALLLFLVAAPFGWQPLPLRSITADLAHLTHLEIWYAPDAHAASAVRGIVLTLLVFVLLAACFYGLGQVLGREMDAAPNAIEAYSINIAGSLVGLMAFAALCAGALPPLVWFTVAAGLWALVAWSQARKPVIAILAVLCIVFVAPGYRLRKDERWSPYQKLTLVQGQIPIVMVNGVGFQTILNLSPECVASEGLSDQEDFSPFNLPYRILPQPRRVLIVGAGTGNDIAAALRAGAQHVDAVEIDPVIAHLGQTLHPEHPYQDPRVTLTITDARNFFNRTAGQYDLIWFGLLDSHVLTSGYNNIRLDNYVYTRQSFEEAKRLLAPGGALVCIYACQRPWMADRFDEELSDIFGHPALAWSAQSPSPLLGWGGYTWMEGDAAAMQAMQHNLQTQPAIRSYVDQHRPTQPYPHTAVQCTDDWPYLYLEKPGLPPAHALMAASLLLLLLAAVPWLRRPADGARLPWCFFFLGAGFLLLETQAISRAALVFGATWQTNTWVIAGVLVMILISNTISAWLPQLPLAVPAAGVSLSLVALGLLPLDWFLRLPGASGPLLCALFLCLPVLFAGLIFIALFRLETRRETALALNLAGALLGGLLESLAMWIGLAALSWIALALYAAALLTAPSRATTAAIPPAVEALEATLAGSPRS
ncbi:MAG: spermine/spermidine synthase domain-containing protein [Candidatus Xenobia bacterium]